MSDRTAQVEKTLALCKEISDALKGLPDTLADPAGRAGKRLNDIIDVLEGIQNKVFFRTKTSLNFTLPALGSAERLQVALENVDREGGDFTSVFDELDSLETNVDVLKVKVASQDIVVT